MIKNDFIVDIEADKSLKCLAAGSNTRSAFNQLIYFYCKGTEPTQSNISKLCRLPNLDTQTQSRTPHSIADQFIERNNEASWKIESVKGLDQIRLW